MEVPDDWGQRRQSTGPRAPDSQRYPGRVESWPWPCSGAGWADGLGLSVLLVPSLPPGVDELPEEQLAAQGAPGVLRVAATAGEAVGVHHAIVGQGVYLEAQRQQSA